MERNFETVDLPQLLCTKDLLRPGGGVRFLSIALDMGGIVAGGASRAFGYNFVADKNYLKRSSPTEHMNLADTWANLRGNAFHACRPDGHKPKDVRNKLLWKCGRSDVDVFFPTIETAEAAVARLREALPDTYVSPTIAGFGHDFCAGGLIFQVITKRAGTPDEVTGDFDIANAKPYFDATGFHFTDEWIELEEKRLLGIDDASRLSLLWRVKKWCEKHSYVDLRCGDHEKLIDALFEAIVAVKADRLERWSKKVDIGQLRSVSLPHVLKSPPGEMLRASMLFDMSGVGYSAGNPVLKKIISLGNQVKLETW